MLIPGGFKHGLIWFKKKKKKKVFADLFKVLKHPELTRWGLNATPDVFLRNEMVAGELAQQFRALAVHPQHQGLIPGPYLEIHNHLSSPVAEHLIPSSDFSGHQACVQGKHAHGK